MNLNDIKYGTIPLEHINSIQYSKDIINDAIESGVIDIMLNNPPPSNDSEETKNELLELLNFAERLTDEEAELCKVLEDNHYDFFAKFCSGIGITGESENSIKSYSKQYDGLVHYLKLKVNRPRPNQLAFYYGIPLFPAITTDANSAAWPSGHTVDFLIILHKLKEKYKNKSEQFDRLYDEIRNIREKSGVHYKSDTTGGELLVSKLIENNLI